MICATAESCLMLISRVGGSIVAEQTVTAVTPSRSPPHAAVTSPTGWTMARMPAR
jgi:hypothetical protein